MPLRRIRPTLSNPAPLCCRRQQARCLLPDKCLPVFHAVLVLRAAPTGTHVAEGLRRVCGAPRLWIYCKERPDRSRATTLKPVASWLSGVKAESVCANWLWQVFLMHDQHLCEILLKTQFTPRICDSCSTFGVPLYELARAAPCSSSTTPLCKASLSTIPSAAEVQRR